jgi:hypothetical protein
MRAKWLGPYPEHMFVLGSFFVSFCNLALLVVQFMDHFGKSYCKMVLVPIFIGPKQEKGFKQAITSETNSKITVGF